MNPIKKAVIIGSITIALYLMIVVITTPALDPFDSINAALQANSFVIMGMGIGVGLQIFLTEKGRTLGCNLDMKSLARSGNSGSAAMTSFFSFFSLVPLGCCGWWLYALSLLPSVFGTGVSAILIEYGQHLSFLGLAIIFGFNGITAYKLHRAINLQKLKNI